MIWAFKNALGTVEDLERARSATSGPFVTEVFPALALPSMNAAFHGRQMGPRDNPMRRKTFQLPPWASVLQCAAKVGHSLGVQGIRGWCDTHQSIATPRKVYQDLLDAVVCALVGLTWMTRARAESIMIGDLVSGCMLAPATPAVRARLSAAAALRGLPVDGRIMAAPSSR